MGLINEGLIQVQAELKNKDEVIHRIAEMLYEDKRTDNREGLICDILKREEELSTSLGLGVAVPHAHSQHVCEPSLVFIKLSDKISWGSDDNIEVIFGIANPAANHSDHHLKILGALARKLMDEEFRKGLFALESKAEVLSFLSFLNDDIH